MASTQESGNGGSSAASSGHTRPRDEARKMRQKAADTARDAAREVKQRGKEQLESGKEAAAEKVEQIASVVDHAASELRDQDNTLARYAGDLASGISRFADSLRNRSVDDLASDLRALAHRSPAAFLLGSVALGLALSRVLKASAQAQSPRTVAVGAVSAEPVDPYSPPPGTADRPLHGSSSPLSTQEE